MVIVARTYGAGVDEGLFVVWVVWVFIRWLPREEDFGNGSTDSTWRSRRNNQVRG